MAKLKILEISNGLGVGGTARTIQTFCRYLEELGHDVHVVGVFTGGKRADELVDEGFPVRIFNGDIQAVKNFLRSEKFDAIHIHRRGAYEAHWLELLLNRPAPVIAETNIFGEYDSATVDLIDYHLMTSQMMLNERYLPELPWSRRKNFWPKYRVLYYPVDIVYFEKFRLSENEILQKKRELGINDGDLVIGKVGARAALEKWSYLVTDMFPLLLKEVPNVKFILQAAPEVVIEDLKRTPYADHFIFCPETIDEAEQAAYYQLLDIFVHTSKIGESFGHSLAEAMVWEKPVVVNSTPGVDNAQLELVEFGVTGYIASTPKSFAAAAAALLKNPGLSKRIGQAGREKVRRDFDSLKTTKNLVNILSVNQNYNYFPSQTHITSYREEYRRRLRQDFCKADLWEVLKYQTYPRVKSELKLLLRGSRY
ncbi:MAG: glycosyltransferase family 4 protein [candidate division WWE3 bacterium]|nr:glycosyltransferase family 4 protein [candidate division WWE3 bacterium]